MTTDRIITKTTTTYCWTRFGDSIERFVVTLLLTALLNVINCWMQWYTKKQRTALEQAVRTNIGTEIIQDPLDHTIDPKFDGKLVHVSGYVKSNAETSDNDFGMVNLPGILKLQRNVEMYQWIESPQQEQQPADEVENEDENVYINEEEKSLTSRPLCCSKTTVTTSYDYKTGWEPIVIDSKQFCDSGEQYMNPSTIPFFQLQRWTSSDITLGEFNLSSIDVVQQMNSSWYVPLADYPYSVDTIPTSTKELVHPVPIHVYSGDDDKEEGDRRYGYFIGADPTSPQVGDIRITYTIVPEQVISIIGQQNDGSITTSAGKYGERILLVQQGIHEVNEMLHNGMNDLAKRMEGLQTGTTILIESIINNRLHRRYCILAAFIVIALPWVYLWLFMQPWSIVAVLLMASGMIQSARLHQRILYMILVTFYLGTVYYRLVLKNTRT